MKPFTKSVRLIARIKDLIGNNYEFKIKFNDCNK